MTSHDASRVPRKALERFVDDNGDIKLNADALCDLSDLFGDLSLPLMRDSDLSLPAHADPLTAYLSRLNFIEPLSADEQQRLALRYCEHQDLNAGKMLVMTNLRLVVKLAREYQRRWTNLLDLIQEGNVGLAEAITRYDPHRGVKFTSYAQYWIRAMILNYLMNHTHPVKIGSSRAGRKLFYNLKKARRELVRRGHHDPTPAQIADYLEVDEGEVVRIAAQLDAPPVYLDARAPGHDSTTIGELMQADADDPEEMVTDYDLVTRLREAMAAFGDTLDDRRRSDIWHDRMIAEDPRSLTDLGEAWGVSKERIRQVEVELRHEFRRFLLDRLGDHVEDEFLERLGH